MVKLPESFLNEMKELLGEEYDAFLRSYDGERASGLRVNRLKCAPEDFVSRSPFELKRVPWSEDGFYVENDARPAKHPYYFAGLYYLQEPSAMFPAAILPVKKYDRVLDVCAAPGGKTTELASKLQNTGLLFSNDVSYSRCQALLKNVELSGITNAVVTSESVSALAKRFPEYFDAILVDAPCSGEGMFRKDPSVLRTYLEHGRSYYTGIQKSILEDAISMLRPGGKIVYSTCTFSVEEDEEIIRYILEKDRSLKLLKPEISVPGLSPGVPLPCGTGEDLSKCVRLFPHKIRGEGHFAALLEKSGSFGYDRAEQAIPELGKKAGNARKTVGFSDLPACAAEFLSHVRKDLKDRVFELDGRFLNLLPEDLPDLQGLRIVRCGLLLGEIEKDRFTPSQSIAMALRKEEFDYTIDFPLSDPRVLRYLKGETIAVGDMPEQKEGYALIAADGFPLGFGKVKNGRLKNKILPGWRYQ